MPLYLAAAGGAGMCLCQWLIFFYAPLAMDMGIIQKVFYIHLPLAAWALCSFIVVFGGSVAYIRKRSAGIDQLCQAACEVGVLFSGLALVTGVIWARKSWGVWWTWDPRLSTTLVMWFIYSAYLLVGSLDFPAEKARLVRAVIGIVAFLDVPLVFLSARIFRSIHPAVFTSGSVGLDPEMRLVIYAALAALGLFWLGLLLLRQNQLALAEKAEALFYDYSDKF